MTKKINKDEKDEIRSLETRGKGKCGKGKGYQSRVINGAASEGGVAHKTSHRYKNIKI
jgi:hypothetical protein